MENFVLLLDDSQLDHCLAESRSDAFNIFNSRGWVIGDIMTLDEYQNELRLNAFESQTIN